MPLMLGRHPADTCQPRPAFFLKESERSSSAGDVFHLQSFSAVCSSETVFSPVGYSVAKVKAIFRSKQEVREASVPKQGNACTVWMPDIKIITRRCPQPLPGVTCAYGGWWSSPTAWLLNERGSFITSPNQRAQPWAQTRADPRWWEGDVSQGDVLVVAGSFPWAADVGCPKGWDLAEHLLFPIENKSRFSNTQTEPYLLLCHLQPPCARFCACRWV